MESMGNSGSLVGISLNIDLDGNTGMVTWSSG